MNKEVEEAIELLEKAVKFYQDFRKSDIQLALKKEDIKKLAILLNYISKLQKEITKKQIEIDTAEEVLKWKGKYHLLSRAKEDLQIELYKKDKVIDLMAEQLAGLAIFDVKKDEPLILGDKTDVEEYFYKKAEEENE